MAYRILASGAEARERLRVLRCLSSAMLGVALAGGLAGAAEAQNVVLGKQIFQGKINCPECHGWAANGVQEDPRAPRGADLRQTAMDRDTIAKTIQCGLPGTAMPFFDVRAYVDDRCYGMTAAQIGADRPPPGTPNLIQREIDAVADYVIAKVVGRGAITREECIEYFTTDVGRCKDFPSAAAR
ncbi:MAG: hypothetical protein EXQ88_07050 [Alphaproteobacteria bacterium]|nr:hypothetical protein [Alphaproteobacteria bacterium]